MMGQLYNINICKMIIPEEEERDGIPEELCEARMGISST